MPKRSNNFQKVVAYIAEQTAPLGAEVKESVELMEKGLPRKRLREVDVLIEINTGIVPVRIALECRDRSRKSDTEWIDGLIGKYRNLPVDKVVAVSSSGFSETAKEKAELNNIIPISPSEVKEKDWQSTFVNLGIGRIDKTLNIASFNLITDPQVNTIDGFDKVISKKELPAYSIKEGDAITVNEFLNIFHSVVLEQAKNYLDKNILSIYKTLADLDKVAKLDGIIPYDGIFLKKNDQEEYEIKSLEYTILIKSKFSQAEVKRQLLEGKAMINSAVLPVDSETEYSVSVVQVANKQTMQGFGEYRKRKKNY